MVEDYCGTNHFDYSKGKKFIFPSIFYVNFKLRITSCRSMDKWRGEGPWEYGAATTMQIKMFITDSSSKYNGRVSGCSSHGVF